jgi:hypothetical protein
MNEHTLSPDAAAGDTPRKPYVVVSPPPPRFPDVLAEITRSQPLTMLSVAFIAGMILAAGWRR